MLFNDKLRNASRTKFFALAAMAFGSVFSNPALAEDTWPTGPVQLYVPAAPGGGTDAVARILAERLQQEKGSPFVVVNLPAGSGVVAAEQVRNAAPDGQTLLFFHSGIMTSYHTGVYQHDPVHEFTSIGLMPVEGSYSLAVPEDAPYNNLADFVAAAKEKPNKLSIGVALRGSTHFMGGLLASASGAEFRFVEAGSDAEKLVQLQGKQIDAALINTANTKQYVDSKLLKVLGTISGSPERDPLMPDVPTMVEQGYKDALYGFDFMVLGPKDMDPALVTSIHDAFSAAAGDPAIAEKLKTFGMPLQALDQADIAAKLEETDKKIGDTATALGLN